nr:retrovirus-related Pol polyprotein from transposon TNT 1-94 [Tanacetum cinerariifolium]
MLRDNALVELRKKFEKVEKEKDELKLTLENFQTSLKNLSKLLESQITDKNGLGYDNQMFTSIVFDCNELISSELDESVPTSPVHDRPSAPIIKDWVSDLEDEYEGEPMPTQKAPSFVQTSKYVKTPKTSVKPVKHPTQPENLKKDIPNSRGHKVLVTKPHNKTPYELLLGRTPSIGFMRPFGCPVTILNTLDPLGKFDGKANEGFLVGYSISSKAFRVLNSRTRIVQETLHISFLENQPNVAGNGPTWLFDIDTLTYSMNYQLVVAGNQPNHNACIQGNFDTCKVVKETKSAQQYVLLPLWSTGSKDPQNTDADVAFDDKENDINKVNAASAPVTAVRLNSTNSTNSFNAAGPSDNVVSPNFEIGGKSSFVDPSQYPDDPNMPALEDIVYFDDEEDVGAGADSSNLETSITVSPIPTNRVHKDHPVTQIIEKDQYNADIRATNILLQGLPKDIYTLINHYIDAKDIWDNVKMLLEWSELTKEDRESQLYDEFEHFRQHKGESIHDYYVRFAKLINDIRNIKITMSRLQLNSKFVNNMLPEWGRFMTAVKLNRGLRDSNYDQLYAYLKQHKTHAKENKMMLEHFSQPTLDPLALLSNVSNPQPYSPSSLASSSPQVPPPLADSSSPTEDLIKNLTNTLALLTQSYRTFLPQTNNQLRTSSNARNQATVQDGIAVVQNVQGRPNRGQGMIPRGGTAAGYRGDQNRVGNVNQGQARPGQARPVKCYNCNGTWHIAQENGVALDAEQLLFLADEFDAFDSNVDEAPTTQTMFMANLSSVDPFIDEFEPLYDSDILSEDNEVPVVHSDVSSVLNDAFMMIYDDMCEPNDQSVSYPSQNTAVKNSLTAALATYKEEVELYERRAMFELTEREQKINEQLRLVIFDRNFKEETLKKELHSIKLQLASTINHKKLMVEEVMFLKKNFKQKENKYLEDFLDMKSLKEKVEDRLIKQDQSLQTVHMLCRPKPHYNKLHKVAIGYKNPLCLTRAKKVHPALCNGHEIIKDNHTPAIVHNAEDTLEIAEITKKKMTAKMNDHECVTRKVKIAPHDYSTKVFRPIKALTVYPPNTPATLIPRVLPTKSQVKIHIFTLIQLFLEFDKTCKMWITPTGLTEGENGFEQTKACYLNEVIPFFRTLKDNFEGIQKALTKEIKEMKDVFEELEAEARCLVLKAELANLRDKHNHDNQKELINHFSKLEVNHLNLQLKYQNLKDIIGNNPPTPDKDTHDFDSVFVISKMQASLQGKDNVIRQLRKQLSQLQVTRSDTDRTLQVHTADPQITKLTEQVTDLQAQNSLFKAENDKIKQHYKELYDSIKITRAKHLDQVTKLTTKNVNLKTSVSKDTVNPQVSARDKHAIDVELIVPRLRHNRDAHLDYLRHVKESVETIRDIIKDAKVVRPLDRSLVSACRYTKHSQELLEYAIGTCPQGSQQRAKQLAHIPLIRKKQVVVANPFDKSDRDRSRLMNFVKKFIWTVRFGNDHFGVIMGYGDYVIGDSVISRVYFVEGLGHNLFSVGQFCDSDLEVAF